MHIIWFYLYKTLERNCKQNVNMIELCVQNEHKLDSIDTRFEFLPNVKFLTIIKKIMLCYLQIQ